ncbi:MAG: serine/threonine-protein kinase [Rubrivivax sp.]
MAPGRAPIAADRWARLSPLLDDLLELDEAARDARLQSLRHDDAALADELQALLQAPPAPHEQRFLDRSLDAGAMTPLLAAGGRCGAWTLMQPIGEGGMGTVWLARRGDGRYDAQAAVKLPHPALLVRGGAARFEREGRLLARLSHPHIAQLMDAGVTAAGEPYLVLEHVPGEAIDRHCDRRRLGVDERVALFMDVLAAVTHAHGQLVLHRDLKPSNVVVTDAGRVKLLDFGIARLIDGDGSTTAADAATTMRAFTPDHAAPEQLQGERVGVATDVYALGVMLYLLLTGRHPTARPEAGTVERLRAAVEDVPPPLSEAALRAGTQAAAARGSTSQALSRRLRGDLDTIVAKALRKAPAERYAAVAAFADDLQRWRRGEPVRARPDGWAYRSARFVRRHRWAVGATAAAFAMLAAAAGTAAWQAVLARRERDDARWQAERAQARANLFNQVLGQMGRPDAPITQRQLLEVARQGIERDHGHQPRLAFELLLPIAGQLHSMGDLQGDLAVMQSALRHATASGDPELVAMAECATVDTFLALRRLPDAAAAVRRARAQLAGRDDAPVPVLVSCWQSEAELAHEQGDPAGAIALAQRARGRLESSGNTGGNLYPRLLSLLLVLQRDGGDLAGALATADRLVALRRDQGQATSLDAAFAERGRALLLAEGGQLGSARAALRSLVSRWDVAQGQPPAPMLISLAQLELEAGEPAAARVAHGRAQASAQANGSDEFEVPLAVLDAELLADEGRVHEARRRLDALVALAAQPARPTLLRRAAPQIAVLHAQLLAAGGHAARARQTLDDEIARSERAGAGPVAPLAQLRRAAAALALAAGDPARAEAQARAALELSTRGALDAGASAFVGRARLLLAQARVAQGDAAGAREQARQGAAALARAWGDDHPEAAAARKRAAGG